jgi:hypothetical protein
MMHVLVLEESSPPADAGVSNLSQAANYGCFRMIIVSPQKHHLHVWDGYEMLISGKAQTTELAQGLSREHGNEVAV